MYRSRTAPLVALALLLVAGTSLQAASMPASQVVWQYNFTPVTPTPSSPVVYASNAAGNNAGITFTNDVTRTAVGPSTSIVATNLKAFAPQNGTFSFNNNAWKLSMLLSTSDAAGPHSATLFFGGKIAGDYSVGHSNLSNTPVGSTTQTVMLGAYDFTVTLLPVILPGPANQGIQGSIATSVSIKPHGTPVPAQTPEPSTMLLSGLGLTFLGASAWRRKRRPLAAA
jgi:hypothetical protein